MPLSQRCPTEGEKAKLGMCKSAGQGANASSSNGDNPVMSPIHGRGDDISGERDLYRRHHYGVASRSIQTASRGYDVRQCGCLACNSLPLQNDNAEIAALVGLCIRGTHAYPNTSVVDREARITASLQGSRCVPWCDRCGIPSTPFPDRDFHPHFCSDCAFENGPMQPSSLPQDHTVAVGATASSEYPDPMRRDPSGEDELKLTEQGETKPDSPCSEDDVTNILNSMAYDQHVAGEHVDRVSGCALCEDGLCKQALDKDDMLQQALNVKLGRNGRFAKKPLTRAEEIVCRQNYLAGATSSRSHHHPKWATDDEENDDAASKEAAEASTSKKRRKRKRKRKSVHGYHYRPKNHEKHRQKSRCPSLVLMFGFGALMIVLVVTTPDNLYSITVIWK